MAKNDIKSKTVRENKIWPLEYHHIQEKFGMVWSPSSTSSRNTSTTSSQMFHQASKETNWQAKSNLVRCSFRDIRENSDIDQTQDLTINIDRLYVPIEKFGIKLCWQHDANEVNEYAMLMMSVVFSNTCFVMKENKCNKHIYLLANYIDKLNI